MTDFDAKLRESLSADDEQFLKSLEDDRGRMIEGYLRNWGRRFTVRCGSGPGSFSS